MADLEQTEEQLEKALKEFFVLSRPEGCQHKNVKYSDNGKYVVIDCQDCGSMVAMLGYRAFESLLKL